MISRQHKIAKKVSEWSIYIEWGVKMLDIQIDKQMEKIKTENPLLFTFS